MPSIDDERVGPNGFDPSTKPSEQIEVVDNGDDLEEEEAIEVDPWDPWDVTGTTIEFDEADNDSPISIAIF